METLIIDKQDIRLLVQKIGLDTLMRDMILGLREVFVSVHSGEIETPARAGFAYQRPQLGLIEWMPGMRVGGPVCVKMVGYHPANPTSLNLPTILSTISLYDTRNGHLLGLADATFLTALRTGAASAVASGWLAKADSQVLGVIGCGAQAVSQIHALTLEIHDFEAQAIAEGECQRLEKHEISTDIASMSKNPEAYAKHRDQLTVFDSTGWAVEDLAAMEILLSYARELGLGHHVDLECISNDPMNPYDFSASTQPLAAVAAVAAVASSGRSA